MRGEGHQAQKLDVDRYIETQINLRRLKSQLPEDKVAGLAQEVIQRLNRHKAVVTADDPSDDQIADLCCALVSDDDEAGAAFIKDARAAGASIDGVYLKYLAGAARMLGDWWETNRISFVQVTLGTSRMYAIMRAMRFELPIPMGLSERQALFASVPGETHTLGIQMATDLFRKEGWEIDVKIGKTHDQILSETERSVSTIIGLSAGGQHAIAELSKLVVALRIAKPTAAIFVSGHVVEEDHETLALMDIDGTAGDIDAARKLLAELRERQLSAGY